MKIIKIFLGSSILDLHDERLEIESFITGLNNKYINQGIYINIYACEETSGAMAIGGSQSVHDKFITDEADATFFMFFHKAGEFTLHELELARSTFIANKNRPNVFVFFKTIGTELVDNDEIRAAVNKIANEYGHYYKSFEKSDTIKLEILQYILDLLPHSSDLIIKDGRVLVDSIPVDGITANNIFAYENNTNLKILKAEIEQLIHQRDEVPFDNRFEELNKTIEEKKSTLNNLEKEILGLLRKFYENARMGQKADPTYQKALQLAERGKIKEAIQLLPSAEQNRTDAEIIEEKMFIDKEYHRNEAVNTINNAILAIELLCTDIDNPERAKEINLHYKAIYNLSCEYEPAVLYYYFDFLHCQGLDEEAVLVGEKLISICDDNLPLSLLIKSYHMLASSYEHTKQYRKAEIIYLEELDIVEKKQNEVKPNKIIDIYLKIYLKLAELSYKFNKKRNAESYYLEAIDYVENTLEIRFSDKKRVYSSIAEFYKKTNNIEKAECYYLKLYEIALLYGDDYDVFESCKAIVKLYNKAKKKETEKYVIKIIELSESQLIDEKAIKRRIEAYLCAANWYKSNNNSSEAKKYYDSLLTLIENEDLTTYKQYAMKACYEAIEFYAETCNFYETEKLCVKYMSVLNTLYEPDSENYYLAISRVIEILLEIPNPPPWFEENSLDNRNRKKEYIKKRIEACRCLYNKNQSTSNTRKLAMALSDYYVRCLDEKDYKELYRESIFYWKKLLESSVSPVRRNEYYKPVGSFEYKQKDTLELITKGIIDQVNTLQDIVYNSIVYNSIDYLMSLAGVYIALNESEKAIELLDKYDNVDPRIVAHIRYRAYEELSERAKEIDPLKSKQYRKAADEIMVKYKDDNKVLEETYRIILLLNEAKSSNN